MYDNVGFASFSLKWKRKAFLHDGGYKEATAK
jgi:hypothetical protein